MKNLYDVIIVGVVRLDFLLLIALGRMVLKVFWLLSVTGN